MDFLGSYFSHQDILQLELRLNIQQGSTYLEIIKIHSGSQKRLEEELSLTISIRNSIPI